MESGSDLENCMSVLLLLRHDTVALPAYGEVTVNICFLGRLRLIPGSQRNKARLASVSVRPQKVFLFERNLVFDVGSGQ